MSERPSDLDDATRQRRDAALVARIRDGDADALGELIRYYALPLSAVASALLGANPWVDDVVQDVFLSLWEHRVSLTVRSNVAGYLRRAVRNRTLNVLRHERAHQRIADVAERDTDLPRVATNEGERRLDDADLDARLRTALRHVPPRPREVFLLNWEGGLSYQEIADLLGVTTRTVSQQMYRATQRLLLYFPRRTP